MWSAYGGKPIYLSTKEDGKWVATFPTTNDYVIHLMLILGREMKHLYGTA